MKRSLQITLFISIFSLFLYIANLVVFEATAVLLAVTDSLQLTILAVALFILSGSFIAATILGMRYYNFFTRGYYTLSALWIGTFTYLFFASILYGIFVVFGVESKFIGLSVMIGALLVALYGILHARSIRITKVTVPLANLPLAWKGRTLLFMSDLHLGQLHGPRFAKKITKKIAEMTPDIICIGGDLFDGTQAPNSRELSAPLKDMSAPGGVYFITGNHEEFGDESVFLEAVKSHGIRVLANELLEIDGLQLVGVDYRATSNAEEFKSILAKLMIDAHKPSILIKHEPKDLEVAQEAGISLQISGHTHSAQMWPFVYIAQLTYKGFAYGLKQLKTLQVYTSSGVGTWGPPLRVGTHSELVLFTFASE